MKFVLLGEPVAKARPRYWRGKGFMRVYNPQEKQEAVSRKQLKDQVILKRYNFAQDAIYYVNISFYVGVAKSATEATRNVKLWGLGLDHVGNSDCDNYLKYILDVGNEILYYDDRQIVSVCAKKKYDKNPRTEIDIMPLDEICNDNVLNIFRVFDPEELKEFIDDVKYLSSISPNVAEMAELRLEWAASLCLVMSKFSIKYADKMKKIEKKVKISGEGKTLC